jgi:hypothetical protein
LFSVADIRFDRVEEAHGSPAERKRLQRKTADRLTEPLLKKSVKKECKKGRDAAH